MISPAGTLSEESKGAPFLFGALLLLFIVSGFSALVYQVVWVRRLVLVFGASGHAIAITLSVFMLGLALGSRFGGKFIDRSSRPLRWYAAVEAGIAIFVALTEPAFNGLGAFVGSWGLDSVSSPLLPVVQLICAFIILLPPTLLMGTTLPILIRQCVCRHDRVAMRTGLLYAANTVGAVFGCLTGGFWLIANLGFHGALMTAVGVNVFIALFALALDFFGGAHTAEVDLSAEALAKAEAPDGQGRLMLFAFFCSGFTALAVECVWTRMLLFHLNSTAQTFAVMLAVYLLCMAVGSFAASRRAERTAAPASDYGLFLLAGALCMVVGLALWATGAAGKSYASFATSFLQTLPAGAQTPVAALLLRIVPPTLVLVALPAFLMGYAFPFAGRFFTQLRSQAAGRFGAAYMLNGLGCMLGPLVAGFVLLPWLGMQGTLLACAGVLVLCGCLLRMTAGNMPKWQAAAVVVVFAALAVVMPERVFSSLFADRSVFYDTQVLASEGGIVRHMGTNKIIFHEEDAAGSVLVMEQDVPDAGFKLRRLYVGPTSMITDNFIAQRYTKLIGQLPALLHEDPKQALVICLGTGMTLSGVAAHPGIEQIDCAEISSAVTRAVHCYDHVNGNVTDDPRVRMIVNDGRTHLAATRASYDIIALEPPPPDNDGAASLYSREFYEVCRDRLNEGGMIAQWIPYHLLTLEEVKSITAAMLDVFPEATLWELYTGTEFCLIGHKTPGLVPYSRVVERMSEQTVLDNLAPGGISGPEDIATCFIAGTEKLREFVGAAPAVTDNRPRIGYDLRNLGLLTELNPRGNELSNAQATYACSGSLTNVFHLDFEENALGDRYRQVRGAFLMDRKLTLIAALGPEAVMDESAERMQAFVAPHTVDASNPFYRERLSIATYIAGMTELVRYHEARRETMPAMRYRMQIGQLKRLLPENYLNGRLQPPQP